MKYLVVLLIGVLLGAVIFTAGLLYNPLSDKLGLSPLAVSDSQIVALNFSVVGSESIVYTNNGDSNVKPYPGKVQQLWESSIRKTSAMATVLRDGRNQAAGFGIKISSLSEKTRAMGGQAIVDSVWYVYLPGRGGLFVEQTENYWAYLRDVVLPGYRSSSNTWKGTWLGNVTSGPESLGTARVTGSSGEFSGMQTLAVESLAVRAWRSDGGAVAADGQLLIELPDETDSTEAAPERLN